MTPNGFSWTGGPSGETSGSFGDVTNWEDFPNDPNARVPGAGDIVSVSAATSISMGGQTVLDLGGEGTILTGSFSVTDTLSGVVVAGGTVSAGTISVCTLTGGQITATTIADSIVDGASVSFTTLVGGITINSGSVDEGALSVKGNSIVVDGGALTASTLSVDIGGILDVAQGSTAITGSVSIVNGGFVVGIDTVGFTSATGGSLSVGGNLSITNSAIDIFSGGSATIVGATIVDMQTSATNTGVTVDGAGSRFFEGGNLTLGASLTGNLAITDSGTAKISGNVLIGDGGTSSRGDVIIDGMGSVLSVAGNLFDGETGIGSVQVTDNGTLELGSIGVGVVAAAEADTSLADKVSGGLFVIPSVVSGLTVGDQPGSNGMVTVNDGNVLLSKANLTVGNFGFGAVNVLNGGQILGVGNLKIGTDGLNDTVKISGTNTSGQVSHLNAVNVSVGSAVEGNGDQLDVSNFGQVSIGSTLHIWGGATLSVASNAYVVVGAAFSTPISEFSQSPYLTISSGGTVISSGTISNALVVVGGLLEVGGYYQGSPVGGTCLINGILTGNALLNTGQPDANATGIVVIDPNATLEVSADIATSRTSAAPVEFDGNGSGTLRLDAPASFAGDITNLAGGDKIILSNTTVVIFSLNTPSSNLAANGGAQADSSHAVGASVISDGLIFLPANDSILSVTTGNGTAVQYSLNFFNSADSISFAEVGTDAVFTVTGPTRTTMTGKAVDGDLSGATVFADANNNGQLDSGEVSTATDGSGNFTLSGGTGPLVVIGGKDVLTGLPFAGQLEAPSGSTVITPLTTLLTYLQNQGVATVAQAEADVLAGFNISSTVDFTTLDPISATVAGDPDGISVLTTGAMVIDTVEMIASALAGAGITNAYHNTFAALATLVGGLDHGATLDLTDATTISTLITTAAQAESLKVTQIVDGFSTIIAAANGAIGQQISSDTNDAYVADVTAVELLSQGAISSSLQEDGGDATKVAATVLNYTGENLANAIAAAHVQSMPAPTISSLTATTDNNTTNVKGGHLVTVTMTTNEAVTVTGTPTLQLNDNEVAVYSGGSGTNTLIFVYVVQTGDSTSDLQVTGLNLPTGASILDSGSHSLAGNVTGDLGIQVNVSTPATVQQEIAGLYVTLYGLAATQAGVNFWTSTMSAFDSSITAGNAGSTPISVGDEVYLGQQMTAGSPVVNGTTYFQTLYPSTMTDLAYVEALYQNMSGFIGTTAGDQYWLSVLQQAEAANGGNVTLAREAIVGQFVHDFYSNNLTVGAAALGVSASDYALLVAGQQTLQNKVTVAQYWATETGVSGGAILNFAHVTDASFAAAQHVLLGITSDPNTVAVAITGINNAVAHQDLSLV